MISRKTRMLKACDRLIGPLLLRLLKPSVESGRSSEPVRAESVLRMLILRPGGLGDAILTLPLITALKSAYPESRIDVLAESRNAGVFEIGNIVDEVYRYDSRPLRIFNRLRRNRYDLVVDTEQYHHLSRMIANALRPNFLCGFDTPDRGRLLTHAIPYSDDLYEARSFLALVQTLTAEPVVFDADAAFVHVHPEARDWAQEQLEEFANRKFVTVMPTAGSSYRLWPIERYGAVVDWLTDNGFGVVLVGGIDALAAAETITTNNRSGQVLNFAGRTTLAQTAGILEHACLSLSADTGVMHLAYGVGTPTVALFGPGRHRKWAPPGRNHRIVRKGLSCSPCTKLGYTPTCPYDIACMQEISARAVISTIKELL